MAPSTEFFTHGTLKSPFLNLLSLRPSHEFAILRTYKLSSMLLASLVFTRNSRVAQQAFSLA